LLARNPDGKNRGALAEPQHDPPRLLIFVIAYYAEASLKRVLERVPTSVFAEYDCEVLVVDDGSDDRTFEVGHEYKAAHPEIRMTVLRNEFNQGYGGNQKVGYAYALSEGFDFVAMLHGDGQYAPEELPRLLAPLRAGDADAVFGSRMLDGKGEGALRGGMPLYKYAGNKILTFAQNHLLGSRLSEFHSGYRIYSTAALRKIRFRLNSNDFHFDTEIIIQLLNAKQRILELPIPTFYGDEICRVNGLKYAKDVLVATLQNTAHRAGILHQRRFDPVPGDPGRYDLKLGYPSSHTTALAAVPDGARVLELGRGAASLARPLKAKQCQVAVVAPSKLHEKVPGVELVVQDLDQPLALDAKARLQTCDYLLFLDVIEHLQHPEQFLCDLRAQFDHRPRTLIVTTPNIAFFIQRAMLLLGQFNYGKAGILDSSHRRLFTFRGLARLLRDEGFRIKEIRGIPAPFPKAIGHGPLARFALAANLGLIRLSKTLFSYQIYIRAESTPDVGFVLANAKKHSAARAADPDRVAAS
jgi:glycosyltransferase involved in cell wall biosynthesis